MGLTIIKFGRKASHFKNFIPGHLFIWPVRKGGAFPKEKYKGPGELIITRNVAAAQATAGAYKFSMTAGRHPESMKNTNYHLSRLAVESHGMGEVEIVEMRGITAGFFKRRMKSVSLSLPSPLILYLLSFSNTKNNTHTDGAFHREVEM
jgi:hypothetical protein